LGAGLRLVFRGRPGPHSVSGDSSRTAMRLGVSGANLGQARTVGQMNRLVGRNRFAETRLNRSSTPKSPGVHAWPGLESLSGEARKRTETPTRVHIIDRQRVSAHHTCWFSIDVFLLDIHAYYTVVIARRFAFFSLSAAARFEALPF
jgi:hypothetical protein